MVFSSVTFLCLFLPIVLGIYHLLFLPITLGSRKLIWFRLCNLFLLLSSLLFYFWGENWRVLIFIGTTLVDFVTALLIFRDLNPDGTRTSFQKSVLTFSICCNLVVLVYFKYFNFGVETLNAIFSGFDPTAAPGKAMAQIVLPLGISFFTFHSMSYTIDVYRGHVKPTRSFIDYACYVLMFPQLVAGPIVRFSYVAESLTGRLITTSYFASGVARFALGLAKKVLVANTVAVAADKIFALPAASLTPAVAWLGAVTYTIQIYFDFSGYSDMAIGLGRMLGFELPQNFDFPYIASSVRDFWRRWHISLSTWFQDYVYIPLGGSHVSSVRTYRNLLTVFLLCGLWHGAKWTFVVWGLYHGLFLILERTAVFGNILRRSGPLAHAYTILVIVVGWVLFRADSFGQASAMLSAMAGFAGQGTPSYPIEWYLNGPVLPALFAGVLFSMPVVAFCGQWLDGHLSRPLVPVVAVARLAGVSALFVLCLMSLASGTYNPFIYFRF